MKSLSLIAIMLSLTAIGETAFGAPTLERIAVMLTGPGCRELHDGVGADIADLAGVRSVDAGSIADHILVDVESERVTSEYITGRLTDLVTGKHCRASLMRSCISPNPVQSLGTGQ